MAPEYVRQRARDVNFLMAMILAEMMLPDDDEAAAASTKAVGGQEPTD